MPRTYVITGAGSEIGAATTDLLREAGATVVGVDLRNSDVTADLSTPEGRRGAVADVLAATGGTVDAVIASVGVALPSALTVFVNYYGAIEFLEALRPTLARSVAPRAAVVGSMSALQPHSPELVEALLTGTEAEAVAIAERLAADPRAGSLVYALTKRAVSRWVRAMSVSPAWAGAGIPLNVVAPGIFTSPTTADLLSSPESIANLLIWLTSPENTRCAGETIYCHGRSDVLLRGEDAWAWADGRVSEYFQGVAVGKAAAEPHPVG